MFSPMRKPIQTRTIEWSIDEYVKHNLAAWFETGAEAAPQMTTAQLGEYYEGSYLERVKASLSEHARGRVAPLPAGGEVVRRGVVSERPAAGRHHARVRARFRRQGLARQRQRRASGPAHPGRRAGGLFPDADQGQLVGAHAMKIVLFALLVLNSIAIVIRSRYQVRS